MHGCTTRMFISVVPPSTILDGKAIVPKCLAYGIGIARDQTFSSSLMR